MVLNVDLASMKVLDMEDSGISRVSLEVTEDDGKTFIPVMIRYNPAMTEADIMRVVEAELDRTVHLLHPSEIISGIASTLTTRGKTYQRTESVLLEEVP